MVIIRLAVMSKAQRQTGSVSIIAPQLPGLVMVLAFRLKLADSAHLLSSMQLPLWLGGVHSNAGPSRSCMLATPLCDARHLILNASAQNTQEHHLWVQWVAVA